jgi:transcriptional regulator GlxA family with amidase domain
MPIESKIIDFRVAEAVRFIKSNFDRDLDFTGLAETLNLSASRLRHLFKQETGVSFKGYVRKERMNRARRLLETSFLTIKEAARRSGISGVSHFVRDFEREFGLSPARYRKRYHSAEKNRLPEQNTEPESEQESEQITEEKKEQKIEIARTANK